MAVKQGAAGGQGLSYTLVAATQALGSGKPFQLANIGEGCCASDHCFSVLSDREWTAILSSRPHQASAEQCKQTVSGLSSQDMP